MTTQPPTDALRLVPRRAVYDWLRDDVPLNVKMTVMPHHIDALLDRLSKAAPASPLPGGGWQDISTAPKDGTPLLAGSIHHSEREVVCWQDGLPSGSMDTDAEWEGWVNDGPQKDRFYANPRYFTHWQPLSAAPTGEPK